MKKILKLSFIALAILFIFHAESNGQTAATVQKTIEQSNKHFIKWFNSGKADSVITQYHANACITNKGCGKTFLLQHYRSETGQYTVRELTTLSVTLKEKIAVENGQWRIQLPNGVELSGKYETEWQQENGKWLILKETVFE